MRSSQEVTVTCEESGSPNQATRKTKTGPPSSAVIETIAEIKDTEPEYMEPLYSIIDPDALDQIFQRGNHDETHQKRVVSFSYGGYDVTVNPADETNTL